MGDVLGAIATLAVALIGGSVPALLLIRRQREKLGADTNLTAAQAEVALSADAREWVEQYAADAREAKVEAAECRAEVRVLRAHLVSLEMWAQRNVKPDAEPMPRLVWPLPNPQVRPATD